MIQEERRAWPEAIAKIAVERFVFIDESAALTNLVNKARAVGTPVADDYIGPSEVILPGPDATLEEVKELLSDEGLIPG